MPPYSAQIQQALREFLREHPGGDGTGDVVGPGGATDGHLAVFDGTTGRLVKDGGAVPEGGGGGLPSSTGANKVLFDDGMTQGWSNSPVFGDTDVALRYSHTAHKLQFKGGTTSEFRDRLWFLGQDAAGIDAGSVFLLGPGGTEIGFETNNDGSNPIASFGVGNTDSFDYNHDGDLFFGRSLNATDDNQTWFGDTVNPVFLIGTPDITVMSPLKGSPVNNGTLWLKGPDDILILLDHATSGSAPPVGLFGAGLENSFDYTHDGVLLFGRNLNATGHSQTWFGDTVNPVFLVGTPEIHVLSPLTLGTDHPFGLRASPDTDDLLLIGAPRELGGTVSLKPLSPTGEGSNGSGIRLLGGNGVGGGGNVLLVAGSDTSEAGDQPIGHIFLEPGYADQDETRRGSVLIQSPCLNFGATPGEDGYGLRDNAGTIEAKNSGGEWAALGGGGSLPDAVHWDEDSSSFVATRFAVPLRAPTILSAAVVLDGSLVDAGYTFKLVAYDSWDRPSPPTASYGVPVESGGGAGSIRLSWSQALGADHLRLYIGTGGEDTEDSYVTLAGTDTSIAYINRDGDTAGGVPISGDGIILNPDWSTSDGLDYRADTLTLGLPGAPTADQTIQPAASTSGSGASLSLNGGTTPAGSSEVDGGSVVVSGGGVTDTGAGGAAFYTHGASGINGGSLELYGGSAGEGGAAGVIQLHSATVADAAITAPDFIVSGSRFKTDTVDGHTASLSCYDVDGEAYVDFIQVTNGNTPLCVVKATDFKSADNSSGVSKVLNLGVLGTLTIKQGIITASTIAEV